MNSCGLFSLEILLTLSSLFSSMGKKRGARAIDFDLDCDKINEALERRKKKKSSKAQLSGKTPGESSARSRGIKDPSIAVGAVSTVVDHDGVEPPHPHMPVTPTPGTTVDHNGFHLSSMTSSLRQTLGSLDYDPDNLTASIDVCDHLYESISKVNIYHRLPLLIDHAKLCFMGFFFEHFVFSF